MPLPLNRKPLNPKNETSKVKPIVVTDPNDKRLRAYNDSNTLYKKGIENEKFYIEHGMTKDKTHEFPFSRVTGYGYANKPKGKIQPISAVSQETNPNHPGYYRAEFLKYKKPVQPVVYQKESPIKKQKAKGEQVKPVPQKLEVKKPEVKKPSGEAEFKQGRKFMKETGLRPGFYKKEELAENSNKKIPIKRR